ncbi:DNA excision repair protein ERCC-6-like 2 [Grifola frondosa]|uniref:DNA excision repair protein ERCC-6-like 2 n=1 Tax=Grifola frondosa TaxID=5627 RepID=A0A1C7MCR4_GRIFR|nr:DNA excision repair protein ERCC-6-like 2 [Grifola frondosa]
MSSSRQTKAEQLPAYNKSNSLSSPIPLDSDSDPDFNPGSFVYEPTRKGRKMRKQAAPAALQESARPKGQKRRREALAAINDSRPKQKRPRVEPISLNNPLLEYFHDLGLQSASEDEADADVEDLDEEDEVEEDEDGDSQVDDDERPAIPKTLAVLMSQSQSQSGRKVVDAKSSEDSVTGNEADESLINKSSLKRKSPPQTLDAPNKKAKLENSDDSVTESESDGDFLLLENHVASDQVACNSTPSISEQKANIEKESDSNSDTEYESDPDESDEFTHPRPSFPLTPDQPLLGPLNLDDTHKIPARINTFLREYQRDGVQFFWERYKEGRGGLLGDDMGLGENYEYCLVSTVNRHILQARRYRSYHFFLRSWGNTEKSVMLTVEETNSRWPTCLIIAPSSVVGNWEREFETWGYFELGMYIGTPLTRADVLNDFKLGRLDFHVITSFDVARRDISFLDDLPWSCIIIDEVHRVKNPRSKLTAAFSRFECTTRFGLTGTAIQNSYLELWTILNWTNPGAVGTQSQWEGYVARPLTAGQSKTASDEAHMKAVLVAQILKAKLLPKFFLRRTKTIIQHQLPRKIDEVVFCPLTDRQIDVYKRILATDAVQSLIHKDELCDCGSKNLRKNCHYPSLREIFSTPTDTTEQTARNRELSQLAFPEGQVPRYGRAMLRPDYCGKWMVLEKLLEDWRTDRTNKVLIFTKSVKLLEMLEFHVRSRGLGYVKLDGSTKQADRMPMIDQFHADPDIVIFLISTLAGGTGLNLTGANKVVIFDPNWNPAHDLQAMDRAYRFGQIRDVSVYRLLGAGSIEELIYARQVYKQQQMLVGYNASFQTRYFEGVQGDKDKQGELFGAKNIFKLHENTLATKVAIEKANIVDLDWALTYMDAKGKRSVPKPAAAKWVYEAEAKGGKEYGDLRGLGALLFDDETAPKIEKENDDIQKTLNDVGIQYTHRNQDLIAENVIEGQRMQILLEEKKKDMRKGKREKASGNAASRSQGARDVAPPAPWPPVRGRGRHTAPLSPQSKLRSRQAALIELEMIPNLTEYHAFAQRFARMSSEEQNGILLKLDNHVKKNCRA